MMRLVPAAVLICAVAGPTSAPSEVRLKPHATGGTEVRLKPDTTGGAGVRLKAEAARLQRDGDQLGEKAAPIADLLVRTRRALDHSRVYLALDEMQDAWTFVAAQQYAAAHAAIKSAAQFAAEWKRAGEPRTPAVPAGRMPAAVAAIAAANAVHASATWRASLPYSEDAGLEAGLYYLGESQAFVRFAAFCQTLPFDAPRAAPAFPPLADEIAKLEAEAAAMYDRAGPDVKPRFIRVNVALKVARTLDEKKQYGAALLQYLVALYRAGVAMAPADADPGDVAARVSAARAGLSSSRDDSLAELFLQRADALLDTPDPAAARAAAVIVDHVIPAYSRLVPR